MNLNNTKKCYKDCINLDPFSKLVFKSNFEVVDDPSISFTFADKRRRLFLLSVSRLWECESDLFEIDPMKFATRLDKETKKELARNFNDSRGTIVSIGKENFFISKLWNYQKDYAFSGRKIEIQ